MVSSRASGSRSCLVITPMTQLALGMTARWRKPSCLNSVCTLLREVSS
jgi:hypothetical protein